MDIRHWGLDRIMQLPDWCFGRKFEVCVALLSAAGARTWDISEIALPEVCVLWEVSMTPSTAEFQIESYRLALGDILPTAAGEMDVMEPLIHGLGEQGPSPRDIYGLPRYAGWRFMTRKPIEAGGRRIVLEMKATDSQGGRLQVVCVFSSIPKEVPDWLVLGQGS